MFDPTSRYAHLPVATLTATDASGQPRPLRYVRRRFIPPVEGTLTLVEHRFGPAERLDTLGDRYAGDPAQFWRICDANDVLQPAELEQPGRVIRIALPAL